MGGKSRSSSPPAQQTVTNVTELPEFAEQFLSQASRRATALTTPQDQFFPGTTVAPFDPVQNEAQNLQLQLARTGSPTLQPAQDFLQNTLAGDFFNAIPGTGILEDTAAGAFLPGGQQQNLFFDRLGSILNRQAPQISSTFERFGRTGSGLADTARAQAASDAFASLIGDERNRQLAAAQQLAQRFSDERGRQIQALGLQPGLESQRFRDAQAISEVGAQRQSLDQARIQDAINRFNFNQDIERQQALQLLGLGGAVTGSGGTTTQTGPGQAQPQSSPLSGALGGGLAGFQAFGPVGGLAGAVLGGLFS